MSKSIRYYYFTTIATVLLISVFVMGVLQLTLAVSYFQNETKEQLQKLVQAMDVAMQNENMPPIANIQFSVNTTAEIMGAEIYLTNESGQVIFASGNTENLLGQTVPARVLQEIEQRGDYTARGTLGGMYNSEHYIVGMASTAELDNGPLYVFSSSNAQSLNIYLAEAASGFVLSAALMMLVASVLAVILTNRTVIPLRRVNEAAQQFAHGNYSVRVPVEGDDELAQLSITFNEMANAFESADSSRRTFMGNIAHELRTPMTTIKGFIDGMLDGTITENERDRYLAIVSDEVGRLARLTKNMLDLSKLEAGEHQPNTTRFDVWGTVFSVFLHAEQRLDKKQIEVKGLSDQTPVFVNADEDFVHQILFNLLDNAIKFTPQGGEIEFSVDVSKGVATLYLQNSGEGISKEVLPHIFDRFYKQDESRNRTISGAGLGLNISKVLLNLMGGRIWADSEEGSWTRFCFTLPTAPK